METIMTDNLIGRRKGYLRTGKVKVEPIRRSSDWLPEESDSAFMNTGAKVEYVVPRLARSGQLMDPLGDLSLQEKEIIAKELGFKTADDLNINRKEKENFWINRPVYVDKNGKFLDLSNIGDYISYKILEVNFESIAPSFVNRYDKGTYKFALVFDDEVDKIKSNKIDAKKEAYMLFGRIDGSAKKMTDFLWIYYLTDKDAKRLPNNPSVDFLRQEVGRIIEEKTGTFLSIMTDTEFETKVLIQKAINNGFITKDGQIFSVFGEPTSRNTLEGMIEYLKDERNNNQRLSLIGKLDALETGAVKEVADKIKSTDVPGPNGDFLKRLETIESMSKETIEKNNELVEENLALKKEIDLLKKKPEKKKPGRKKVEVKKDIEVKTDTDVKTNNTEKVE